MEITTIDFTASTTHIIILYLLITHIDYETAMILVRMLFCSNTPRHFADNLRTDPRIKYIFSIYPNRSELNVEQIHLSICLSVYRLLSRFSIP